MQHNAAFHQVLHYLQKYMFTGFQNISLRLITVYIMNDKQTWVFNILEKTDSSEIDRTYNIRNQHAWFYSVCSGELIENAKFSCPLAPN